LHIADGKQSRQGHRARNWHTASLATIERGGAAAVAVALAALGVRAKQIGNHVAITANLQHIAGRAGKRFHDFTSFLLFVPTGEVF